jgi:hypothetical protein
MRRVAILALSAALLAGCAGGSKHAATTGTGAAGAGVAPKSTAMLVRLDTSFESEQWHAFESLLRMFPGGEKALAELGGNGTTLHDLRAALGPETDVIALNRTDLNKDHFVALTQADDKAKLHSLLAKDSSSPSVSEDIAGWQTIADDRATIDRFKAARNGGTLSGNTRYTESLAGLPSDSIASLFVDGSVVTRAIDKAAKTGSGPVPGLGRIGWLSAALTARQKAFVVDLQLKGDEIEAAPYTAELPAEVPADVSLFFDFKGLNRVLDEARRTPAIQKRLGVAEQAAGSLLDEVVDLFKDEAAFYIRHSGPEPEVTLVLKVSDETAAKATLDKVATLAGASAQATSEPLRIGRFSVQKLTIQKTSIYYGVFDGKLVVTTARDGITGLSSSRHLTDSQRWHDATSAAAAPEQSAGIFFADFSELVELAGSSSTSSSSISPQEQQAFDRLGTILIHGSVDNGVLSLKGLVSVR